ncbi:PREDICTED: uncharacterized protein LOC108765349 [Trachymyrmex cornetzi]|uniref:uncharacterized protein LOC108765349 n=1 Tax=Trachymyrmex cornetzi TaxID=471704 RepID=UPI00084F5F51|nr:PREDICTED: uncharacterized protein LOC108765349 [Trachymyrmex cornetzi]
MVDEILETQDVTQEVEEEEGYNYVEVQIGGGAVQPSDALPSPSQRGDRQLVSPPRSRQSTPAPSPSTSPTPRQAQNEDQEKEHQQQEQRCWQHEVNHFNYQETR